MLLHCRFQNWFKLFKSPSNNIRMERASCQKWEKNFFSRKNIDYGVGTKIKIPVKTSQNRVCESSLVDDCTTESVLKFLLTTDLCGERVVLCVPICALWWHFTPKREI